MPYSAKGSTRKSYLQLARENLFLRRGNKPTNPCGECVVALGLPVAGADVAVGLRDPAEHGDGETDGEVGHVVGEYTRGVGDPHPAVAAPGEVDAVKADGVARDDLEPRERVDKRGVTTAATAGDEGADGRPVRAEEVVAAVLRGVPAEAEEAAAAAELLLQVRVHGVQQQHAQGLHGSPLKQELAVETGRWVYKREVPNHIRLV